MHIFKQKNAGDQFIFGAKINFIISLFGLNFGALPNHFKLLRPWKEQCEWKQSNVKKPHRRVSVGGHVTAAWLEDCKRSFWCLLVKRIWW